MDRYKRIYQISSIALGVAIMLHAAIGEPNAQTAILRNVFVGIWVATGLFAFYEPGEERNDDEEGPGNEEEEEEEEEEQPAAAPTHGNGRHAGIRRDPRDDDEGEGVIVHPPLQDQQPPLAAQ